MFDEYGGITRIDNSFRSNSVGGGKQQKVTFENGQVGYIDNSFMSKSIGGGNQRVLRMNDGSEYHIDNSFLSNTIGGGHQQKITQTKASTNNYSTPNYDNRPPDTSKGFFSYPTNTDMTKGQWVFACIFGFLSVAAVVGFLIWGLTQMAW